MSKNQRALSGFKRMKDDEILTQAKIINRALSENEYYEEPSPELVNLTSTTEDYETKLADARKKGSPFETALKNQAREKLETVLFDLAFYVNKTADGDLPILLSSGFPVSSVPRTLFSPDVVKGVELSDGRQPGQLRLDFQNQESTLVYEYRFTKEKDASGVLLWDGIIYKTSSSRSNIIPVEEGFRYFVQVRAINTKGIGVWSEAISLMAR